ncbi:MAG TPA: hypothetical protein PLQ00_17305, partial [Thermoguttaceae bacterium]|nr:hypothetical protein [Thermoguttaceae bacterium]
IVIENDIAWRIHAMVDFLGSGLGGRMGEWMSGGNPVCGGVLGRVPAGFFRRRCVARSRGF